MKQYPELQHFTSPEQAKKGMHAWKKRMMKMPAFWVGLAAYTIGVGVLVSMTLISIRPWFTVSAGMFVSLVVIFTGGSGMVVLTWFWRHRCQRFLRQQLIASGIPICLKCGYDLRGQIEPRCPECGTLFDVQLIAGHKKQDDVPP